MDGNHLGLLSSDLITDLFGPFFSKYYYVFVYLPCFAIEGLIGGDVLSSYGDKGGGELLFLFSKESLHRGEGADLEGHSLLLFLHNKLQGRRLDSSCRVV